jgi:ABC-type sugar transport system ATPase subunit
MIYQELDLILQMTVEENLMLGYAPRRFGMIDRRKRSALAKAALLRVGAVLPVPTAWAACRLPTSNWRRLRGRSPVRPRWW